MRLSDFVGIVVYYLCGCALWFAAYAWLLHRPRLGDLAGAVAIVAVVLIGVVAVFVREDDGR